MALLNISLT